MSLDQSGLNAVMPPSVSLTNASGAYVEVEGPTLDRSSCEASLLDSCEGEDDEDAADSSSIQARLSEDYTPYVDETGQMREKVAPQKTAAPMSNNTASGKIPPPPAPPAVREVSLSPPQMDGLAFDLNQPWERSLLRQLEKGTQLTSTTAQTKTMLLLGHTESRDFAMEYDPNNDDNFSLDTSSSCPPQRMQFIHRPAFLPPEPRVVYRIPPSNDDDVEDYKQAGVRKLQQVRHRQQRANFDGRDDDLEPQGQHKYLEMEASTGQSYNEDNVDLNIPDLVHHTTPDPGCFCLGYNMLEYVLSPPAQPRALKRNVGVLRPARLPRVDEADTNDLGAMAIPEVIAVSNPSNKKNSNSREKSVEPEGSYFTASENYYTSASEYYAPSSPQYTSKRQGIDW